MAAEQLRRAVSDGMLDRVTPLLITFNEAPNIQRTLDKLDWAKEILIVDSFSDDQTLDIVSRNKRVRVMTHKFESFADQCNFGLAQGNIGTEWVLNLDADYVLTDEFIEELKNLNPAKETKGYRSRFVYCVDGRPIRSGIYPPVTVLFRKAQARFKSDGHAHRVDIDGQVESFKSAIFHDDRKPLTRWFQSQAKYAELEAKKLSRVDVGSIGLIDRIRRWRVIAPFAMPVYCLIFRGGVFDGWAGFYYAFQRALAELMLSLYLFEHSFGKKVDEVPGSQCHEVSTTTR